MPDSSDIENALVAKLGADATLLALLPNGAYFDEAPAKATRFVIVSLVDEQDVGQFGGRAFEDALYLVEARAQSADPITKVVLPANVMKDAAARIDALLEGQPLTVSGYALMTMHRESRVRLTEVDDADSSIRWYRRGGQYRVQMSVG
jgi:hypothetical protein